MSFDHILAELNTQQQQATMTTAQNCLVLAGAGCGKTKTIVARAAYLINQGMPANQVQILTFTRRAASEIATRVEQYLGEQAKGIRASTFHTFCVYLLRRAPKAFGLEGFSIIDRDDQVMIFRLLRGKGNDTVLPKAAQLCDIYSYARNTQIKLSDAIVKILPDALPYLTEVKEVMSAYETRKSDNRYLDYDDILAIVAGHLAASPALADWVSQLCSVILVDEMQDTNPLQWALLSPLLNKSQLFCVGDDAQSIYGFRGADFENIHHFKDRVPDATVLTLQKNYRSTQEILDVSNWLLSASPIDYQKELVAFLGKGKKPELHLFPNEFEEANWLVQDLQRRHKIADWHDHMILVRSAYAARHIESSLIRANVPYRFIGGTKLLESAHVKDLLSFLRISANPQDEIAWMRFLTLWNGIGDVGASKLVTKLLSTTTVDDQYVCLEQHGKVPTNVILILKQLSVLQQQVKVCIELAVEALSEQLEQNYKNQDWMRRKKDFPLIQKLAQKHSSLTEFLEEYVLEPISISEVEQSKNNDVVTLITVHSAKGTEQQVCYVPQLTANQYPHVRSQGDFDAVEEERRILYVALTRAKKELILTKPDFNTWSMDSIDEEGRKVSQYLMNNLPSYLVDIHMHKRQGFTHSTPKSISFGIDLD